MYIDVLWILNFIVDFLLLIAANRLSGYPTAIGRTIISALLGGFYGSFCVIPGLVFLSNTIWRLVALGGMACIAFGFSKDALRRGVVYIFLSMALGGIAIGLGHGGFLSLILCALLVCLMCIFGLRGKLGNRFVPVVIRHNGNCYRFTAMVDTGNSLTDPITGQQVMVVSADLGQRILGEGPLSFSDPIATIRQIQGGRLVPYHTIGTEGGMLAAKRFQDVTIGKWHGNCLVAFSPKEIGRGEAYEALTGGIS